MLDLTKLGEIMPIMDIPRRRRRLGVLRSGTVDEPRLQPGRRGYQNRMMTIREASKTRVGRRLIFLGLTTGWRLANSPTGRKAMHAALSRAERRRKSRRGHARVSTLAGRVAERVRA